jgi:hypothetical protein
VYACEENNEIVGYSVLSTEKNTSIIRDKPGKLSIGNIIDFITLSSHSQVKLSLLSRSLDYFEHEGIDIVRCWTFKGHADYAMFSKFGFSGYYELLRRAILHPEYVEQFIMYANSRTGLLKALESNQTRLTWFIMQGDADYN